jgi:hypothetical protein
LHWNLNRPTKKVIGEFGQTVLCVPAPSPIVGNDATNVGMKSFLYIRPVEVDFCVVFCTGIIPHSSVAHKLGEREKIETVSLKPTFT